LLPKKDRLGLREKKRKGNREAANEKVSGEGQYSKKKKKKRGYNPLLNEQQEKKRKLPHLHVCMGGKDIPAGSLVLDS